MKKNVIFNIVIYLAAFLVIFPLIVLILWGFSKRWPWPYVLPIEYSLRGATYFLTGSDNSIKILLYSIWLSFVVTVITLIISVPAARALGLYEFKGKGFFKLLVLLPLIISPVAVGIGIQVFFIKVGLANTFLGVVLVHLIPCLPYGIRILTNVFEILGESMESQARTLGASKIQTFFYVTLPLISPGLISAASLVFIVSFSQYFLTFIVGGGNVVTLSMVMFPFIESGDRMIASSYSIVFIAATLILLVIMEKRVKAYYTIENHFYI
ncbi:ABC transporter permease subunit [Clostridium tagluense]|uniref:ABC transporter permease n=1 Tax=Clostridium tagluense TaxID=360422 RepID=UPI001C0AF2AD|nr:ABC transporter permease subunit [Clostridium tagluense]MBU3129900.1 ABC transporter permease subunit [Clostridium tagluense]MCB2313536.1 ABC transporter permease subunit [Clostridium tagluense]MCB2318408.1 ABC transporter permease subunit [Clostridium tagluense]MCB2323209.1 ABC transporter permease subunit [Clostridium tagluense]MCB2328144.1 ABC transporter permease subunit [Clostridium tagluense]